MTRDFTKTSKYERDVSGRSYCHLHRLPPPPPPPSPCNRVASSLARSPATASITPAPQELETKFLDCNLSRDQEEVRVLAADQTSTSAYSRQIAEAAGVSTRWNNLSVSTPVVSYSSGSPGTSDFHSNRKQTLLRATARPAAWVDALPRRKCHLHRGSFQATSQAGQPHIHLQTSLVSGLRQRETRQCVFISRKLSPSHPRRQDCLSATERTARVSLVQGVVSSIARVICKRPSL